MTQKNRRHAPFRVLGCQIPGEQYRDRLRDFDILQPGQKPGKYQLGLWKAIRMVLLDCGVLPEHISVTDICTRCNCGYLYSHRITGFERGNMAAFLSIAD